MKRSNGGVFRDLGFSKRDSEHLKVRAQLMAHLQKILSARRLTQRDAAKTLGVTQPRVSNLMQGRIDLFSTDALIEMLARLGIGVKMVVKSARRRPGAA
jgi:predicted XRE-type DNA-binding protein